MKNKKNLHIILSISCFAVAIVCAFVYALWEKKEVRFLAAAGFAACCVVCFKMFLEYLKDIGFGKKLFAPLRKFFAKLYKSFTDKLNYLTGKDEDKLYVSGKKDEFKIKFEFFKAPQKSAEKKARVKLPKYSSLTEEKEKIRYIYTVFLRRKIERGYTLSPSRTPEEIGEDFAGDEKAKELFSCYPAARYADESEPIDSQSVKKLENIIK